MKSPISKLFVSTVLLAISTVALSQGVKPENAVEYLKLSAEAETFVRSGNFKDALPKLKKLKEIYPRDGDVRYSLAQALLNQGKPKEAIPEYLAAMELGAFANKFKANCLYDLACCYSKLGDSSKGFSYLGQALDAGFRDIGHVRTDEDLLPLRTNKDWIRLTGQDDVSKMSRDEAWRYDLWFLNRELRRIHLNPYRSFTPKQFDDHVKKLNSQIPKLADEQIMVGFQRLMAMAGDGHTGMRPDLKSPMVRQLPVQLFWFEDGMYVTAASKEHADLASAKVVRVDGKSIEELFTALNPLISQDNPMSAKATFSHRISFPGLMFGAGVASKNDSLTLSIVDTTGKIRDVNLKCDLVSPDATWVTARNGATNPEPLYMKNRQKAYFAEFLPDLGTMYVQYNAVRNDPAESLTSFSDRVFKEMDEKQIQKLILDVRWNGGGNTFLSRPFHEAIMRRERFNQKGNLFIITGRNTFSAAQNFVTDITRFSNPILVGEPTGSCPNFVGETIRFTLPFSKANCSVSDLYWQRSWPMDHRIWIAPDLPAPPVFSLYKENRDPAMEAIRAFLEAK